MYSAIWPLAIAPTIAPTFDKEPNKENCSNYIGYSTKLKLLINNGKKGLEILTCETVRPRSSLMAVCVGEE